MSEIEYDKMVDALEAANAELKRKGDKLAAFLGEIEMNARGRCVDLEQANWKLEQIQKRAYLALDGKLE